LDEAENGVEADLGEAALDTRDVRLRESDEIRDHVLTAYRGSSPIQLGNCRQVVFGQSAPHIRLLPEFQRQQGREQVARGRLLAATARIADVVVVVAAQAGTAGAATSHFILGTGHREASMLELAR
jgi:hypothetical protein